MLKTAIVTSIAMALATIISGQAKAVESVIVLRGGASETVETTGESNLPTVLRGKLILARAATRKANGPPVRVTVRPIITGGEVLWYFSDRGRRLTACYLRGTGNVGQRRIVCTQNR